MSDLKRVGIQAVAEGAADYLATLQKMEEATSKFGGALSPAAAALSKTESAAAAAGREVAGFASEAKKAERIQTLTDRLGLQQKQLGILEQELTQTAAKYGESSLQAQKKQLTIDRLTTSMGATARQLDAAKNATVGYTAGVEAAENRTSLLNEVVTGAARKLGELAIQGFMAAGQAVMQFAKDGIRAAGDFEAGMNTFQAVVGGELETSGLKLEDFKQLFISLGRDLPVSTAEVQQAAIEMSKGGIDPATIAAGGLRQTLEFAAASGMDLAEAAQTSAKVLQGWVPLTASAAEKAQFLGQAEDILTKATTAAATTVPELAIGLFNVQGTAKAAGVSLNDTVTTLALLTPSFKSSATAGDSLKNMLQRFIPQTTAAADAMANLSLLTDKGSSKFFDAEGHFIGMRDAADLLQRSMGGLSEAQKLETLRTIFGNDALNAANVLIEQGAAGYDAVAAKIALQAGVTEQAALKQQGFNVAVDNMMGSLEAFQITVGSAVLPVLTSLVNTIAGAINVVTNYADATMKGETALSTITAVINTLFIPAVTAATAVLVGYSVAAIAPVLVNVPAMTAVLIYNTGAWIANAAAVAAAALPLVAIGIAIGGVVLAWRTFNESIANATQNLLNSRPWWTDSTAAIDDYAKATGTAKDALSPLAASITAMRTQIQGEIEDLGRRSAAGLVNEQQYNNELAVINQHAEGLRQATDAYNSQRDAIARAAAAQMTATAAMAEAKGPLTDLGGQASLTADDIDKLNKSLQGTYEKGQQAVQAYATTQSEFLSGVESRQQDHTTRIAELEKQKQAATTAEQKRGLDQKIAEENAAYLTSEQNAAASYVRAQAAQKQHLGQMLVDYTVAQAQLGNIGKDKAAEIASALEKEYGLQESSVASTFLKMAGSIDSFAKSSSGSIEGLIGTLRDQQTQAADTQKAMDDYSKTYTATAVANFVEKKGEAKDYTAALEAIPSEVQSTLALPGIYDRNQEIQDIKKDIDRIPRHVTVTIDVVDKRPKDIVPHSPTDFEMGIYGITDALNAMGAAGADAFSILGENADQAMQTVQQIAGAAAGLLGDMADISRQEIANLGQLDKLTTSRAAVEKQLADIKAQAQQIETTDPEKAKAYYAMESKHAIEMGQLQDEQTKAAQDRTDALAKAQRDQSDVSTRTAQQYEADQAAVNVATDHLSVLDAQRDALVEAQRLERQGFEAKYAGPGRDVGGLGGLTKQLEDLLAAPTTPGIINDLTGFIQQLYNLVTAAGGLPQQRAAGGPVDALAPYIVGEAGPELFVPRQAGQILPSFAQMGAGGGRSIVTTDNSRTINMPVYTTSAPNLGIAPAIINAMMT